MSIIKRKIDVPDKIDTHMIATLKTMGNIQEISVSDSRNHGATIVPLSKEKFVVVSTGEVKQVQHHALDRTENLRNLEKAMHNLSDLINANITSDNVERCRFLTFTYRDNMQNPEQLYNDFKNFNKRFKRYMAKSGYHYEYIITVEAQERGAFHLHGIFIFDNKAPFIENKTLADMWGLGFVSIKSIDKNIDNIGKYLTAYLTDLPVNENTIISTELVGGKVKEMTDKGKSKKIIKSARLKMLPVGIRIYRYSRGIKKPIVSKLPYGEVVDHVTKQGFTKVNEYALEISDVERDFKSKYVKQTFKKHINKDYKTKNERSN
jgi:hypothetical protein